MNKREASLILGISPSASKIKVTDNHLLVHWQFLTKIRYLLPDQRCPQENHVAKPS
jgi:hypothetical protein